MNNLTAKTNLPVLRVPKENVLPDNAQWTNRFEIRSQSSGRVYIVAQNKQKRHFGCSCPGWRRYRHCKHLQALSLPGHEQPHEVSLYRG